ncbi:MAG: Unknown protein [uncultured Aureispira sp.]|uniref:DUF7793 domain-containing protein n=1 Tax=uncultured Aureispira sp. TaxID=1331704 RepID=A0A6S6TN11_9BACT|nr:MAG: Unknown protein [uncultured Aureispira sp.]
MEFETKEFTIRFLDERIIVLEQKKSIGRMTKEGAIECAEKMIDLCNSNANSKVIVFHVGSLYIKKDVMRVFSDQPAHESVICTALVSPSFLAKNIASIILKMRARFVEEDIPTEIFGTEAEAIKWVRTILDSTP